MKNKTYIQICGDIYPVEMQDGIRMVKNKGRWISGAQFIEDLSNDGEFEKFFELVKLGKNILDGNK